MAFSGVTPTKLSKSIQYTPTKQTVCVLCGGKILKSDYRRKLFHGSEETKYCSLIEHFLEVDILPDAHTDIACRTCIHSLCRAETIIENHKKAYRDTLNKLKHSHGRVSEKRMSSDFVNSEGQSKRKSLFGGVQDEDDMAEEKQESPQSSQRQVKLMVGEKDNCKLYDVSGQLEDLVLALVTGNIHLVTNELFKNENLRKHILDQITSQIQAEIRTLCAKEQPSVLRQTDKKSLMTLTWESILHEWKIKAPTFQRFIQCCIDNPSHSRNKIKKGDALLPGMVTAGCKLLSLYNKDMNVLQHLNSIILIKGGAKKTTFARLNASQDCLSYTASIKVSEQFGELWSEEIKEWGKSVEEGRVRESLLLQEIKELKESIDVVNGDPTMVVDHILELADLENQLTEHRKSMHPGYYFVGDNVDMRTKVRQMTQSNQCKDHHMFQMCAYENRISGNHLDDTKPKKDVSNVPFATFLPSEADNETLISEFVLLVAWIWTSFIHCLNAFRVVLPDHIEHQYMKETKKKTKRINMGVLQKNEQYNEEMTDICQFLHQYVPGHDSSADKTRVPNKTLSGGDYLTFERHKQAQTGKLDGRTPSSRLEGLIPKMEEFHNQAELLQVIWKLLYSASSSKDVGTLYAARVAINSRNVTTDPSDDYYASSELMEKFTKAYIIVGGLNHFGMESCTSEQAKNTYTGEIGDKFQMKAYILDQSRSFVNEYVYKKVPKIPSFGAQSNSLQCRYCGKDYVKPKAFRKHENVHHGHADPLFDKQELDQKTISDDSKDHVLNYTKLVLTLGLLRLNHNDALSMGDGERVIRIDNYLCLYYKVCGCPKYAYGMLETLAQSKCLLTERLAHRLIWNRTVNHRGEVRGNHPNDLDLEHCNRIFKDEAHSYRGEFTDKTVSRVSRSAATTNEVTRNFDKICSIHTASGKHTDADTTKDILTLVEQIFTQNVFNLVPGRSYTHFPNMKENPMESLDTESLRDWISDCLKKI